MCQYVIQSLRLFLEVECEKVMLVCIEVFEYWIGKGREFGVIIHLLWKFRLLYQWLDDVYGTLDTEGIDGSHNLVRIFLGYLWGCERPENKGVLSAETFKQKIRKYTDS